MAEYRAPNRAPRLLEFQITRKGRAATQDGAGSPSRSEAELVAALVVFEFFFVEAVFVFVLKVFEIG